MHHSKTSYKKIKICHVSRVGKLIGGETPWKLAATARGQKYGSDSRDVWVCRLMRGGHISGPKMFQYDKKKENATTVLHWRNATQLNLVKL